MKSASPYIIKQFDKICPYRQGMIMTRKKSMPDLHSGLYKLLLGLLQVLVKLWNRFFQPPQTGLSGLSIDRFIRQFFLVYGMGTRTQFDVNVQCKRAYLATGAPSPNMSLCISFFRRCSMPAGINVVEGEQGKVGRIGVLGPWA